MLTFISVKIFSKKTFVSYNCVSTENKDAFRMKVNMYVTRRWHRMNETFLSHILKLRTVKNSSHFEKAISCIWPAAVTLETWENSNFVQTCFLRNYYLYAAGKGKDFSTCNEISLKNCWKKIATNSTQISKHDYKSHCSSSFSASSMLYGPFSAHRFQHFKWWVGALEQFPWLAFQIKVEGDISHLLVLYVNTTRHHV